MQSFSPLYTYEDCARVLDNKRCFKNALEAYQVLRIIRGVTNTKGWRNHPVTLMWAKYPNSYVEYALCFTTEWLKRGYKTTLDTKLKQLYNPQESTIKPDWWDVEEFHSSHRQTLLTKDFNYYSKFGWSEQPKYEYWWPTQHGY